MEGEGGKRVETLDKWGNVRGKLTWVGVRLDSSLSVGTVCLPSLFQNHNLFQLSVITETKIEDGLGVRLGNLVQRVASALVKTRLGWG